MSDNLQFDPLKLSIVRYGILKETLETAEGFDPGVVVGYELTNRLNLSVNIHDRLLKVSLVIGITTGSDGANVQEATAGFEFVFMIHVDNMQELIRTDKNGLLLAIHPWLSNSAASVAYSTTRGLLLTKLDATVFQGFILPIIDPAKLL